MTAAALYVDEPAADRERRVVEVMNMLGLAGQADGEVAVGKLLSAHSCSRTLLRLACSPSVCS